MAERASERPKRWIEGLPSHVLVLVVLSAFVDYQCRNVALSLALAVGFVGLDIWSTGGWERTRAAQDFGHCHLPFEDRSSYSLT